MVLEVLRCESTRCLTKKEVKKTAHKKKESTLEIEPSTRSWSGSYPI